MLIRKSQRKKEFFGKNDLVWDYPMADEKIGIAFHEINGRSPESGWGRNNICYEAYYIISGSAKVFVEDKEYNVAEGDVFVVDKKEKSYLIGKKLKLLTITLPNWYNEQCEIVEDFIEKKCTDMI